MQRTYKSKKDLGGALDPRDVLFSLDDKRSAFDAFYINNIKQAKRELSCMGSTNQHYSASNRVRKRKYVKRVIKEVKTPPPRDSMSTSTYLTPDKSIRVNRCQDLFDQLLNSSSPHVQKPKTDKDNLFDKLSLSTEKKTVPTKKSSEKKVATKKPTKTKKREKVLKKNINFSSSDETDSDKENGQNNICSPQNTTDLGKHQLIIEKAPRTTVSPRCQDKSINQIINDMSLMNNIMRCRTPINIKKNKYLSKNRLTKTLQSPDGQTSPLCSTPFTHKYRGQSIYKFSPISLHKTINMDKSNISQIEIENDNNKCLISVVKNAADDQGEIQVPSPILRTSKDNLIHSQSNVSRKIQGSSNNSKNYSATDDFGASEKEENIVKDSLIQYSTEYTPFLGFTNNSFEITSNEQLVLDVTTKTCEDISSKSNEKSIVTEKSEELNEIFEENSNPEAIVIRLSTEIEPLLGFSEHSLNPNKDSLNNDESVCNDNDYNSNDEATIVESALLKPEEENKTELSNKRSTEIDRKYDSDSSNCDSISDEQSNSSESDVENSFYDTCSSLNDITKNDSNDTSDENTKELDRNKFESKNLIVKLDRLNDDTFYRYYKKNTEDLSNTSSSSSNNIDCSGYEEYDDKDNTVVDNGDSINETVVSNEDSVNDTVVSNEDSIDNTVVNNSEFEDEDDDDADSSDKDERVVSFVTTRRRNNVTDVSVLMHLTESDNSDSDSEDNKTVLSNRAINIADDTVARIDNLNLEKDVDVTVMNAATQSPDSRRFTSDRESRVNLNETSICNESKLEKKAPIVLQPGKKWERSLSIYRRMTMMPDNDLSMLDEADSTKKGRNYRQSIVNTMHLQKNAGGPLHNESFTSCRSSIASKPHRATIKIVKEPNSSKLKLHRTAEYEDLTCSYGFVHEDCDDTVIDLSKLSITDSDLDVTVVQESVDRLTTARDYVLRRCNQKGPILFDECYPDSVLKNCHKIGEGVYGEVFLWRARDGRARVMKVVPIAGTTRVNGEHQKDFHEVISEVVIAMELSALRAPIADIENHFDAGNNVAALDLHAIENATDCFNEVLAVRCVVGKYPSRLLELWELYDECKGSENDSPEALPPDQHYLVLELANAGVDLETYQFASAEQAYALFYQVAFALAVGEEAFQFEHRDLHWGNVLIAPTDEKYATFILRGRSHRVLRRGVSATIIDYSLSRISLPLAGSERAALYNDLGTDESLFDAVGDYQFDVYRSMREKLGNEWKNFEPYTNILWLHYVVDKMITALRYKRINTKVHKHFIGKLKSIKNRLLAYGSAVQFVLTDNEY